MKSIGKKGNPRFSTVYYYLGVVLAFNILIWITPVLAIYGSQFSAPLYSFFSLFCHQMFERSLCLSTGFNLGNCDLDSAFTYQFPVCSRDTAFYFTMLIGGAVYYFQGKKNELRTPSLYILVLFVLPLAIDGTTQLFGLRESTNVLRILTGGLAGLIIPFFLIPISNRLVYSVGFRKKK